MAQLRRSVGEASPSARISASGQLPIFEREYLTAEIRRVAVTTTALLALIIVLAILLR